MNAHEYGLLFLDISSMFFAGAVMQLNKRGMRLVYEMDCFILE
jgi:hypothetical protein